MIAVYPTSFRFITSITPDTAGRGFYRKFLTAIATHYDLISALNIALALRTILLIMNLLQITLTALLANIRITLQIASDVLINRVSEHLPKCLFIDLFVFCEYIIHDAINDLHDRVIREGFYDRSPCIIIHSAVIIRAVLIRFLVKS